MAIRGEENWSGYFRRGDDELVRGSVTSRSNVSLARYGRAKNTTSRHGWETAGADDKYARWDITQTGMSADGTDDYRNELNTFGYMVEIDPYDKTVAIRKRTALGRFAHESGAFGKLVAGKPLAVYMGDDSRGEYIYKFVSNDGGLIGADGTAVLNNYGVRRAPEACEAGAAARPGSHRPPPPRPALPPRP